MTLRPSYRSWGAREVAWATQGISVAPRGQTLCLSRVSGPEEGHSTRVLMVCMGAEQER